VYATIPSFWLLIHPRAGYWRDRRGSPFLILIPAWVAMWLIAGLATWRWRFVQFYNGLWGWIPAILLFGAGIWIYRQAGANFSWEQLGGLPELRAQHREQRLVTTGIRARVRHPVYLAHLLEMLAWSLGTGVLVCFALSAFAMVSGAIMIRQEDRELEARFGDPYQRYRRAVPSVIPRPRFHP
jgi:protein-S-isoprenylcysteine O-methyltransferase Ste14